MIDDRPGWARRMTNDREARHWSQADAVRAMRAHAPGQLPGDASLLPDCSTFRHAASKTETNVSIVSGSNADWASSGTIGMEPFVVCKLGLDLGLNRVQGIGLY